MSDENIKNSADHLQTLEKGLKVIEAFNDRDHLTISETSKAVGISRPTARRVLITLVNLGYAQMLDNRFYLTPKVLSLGYSYMTARDSWEITTTLLRELSKVTNESSSLAKLVGEEIVYIGRVPANKIMKISLNIGTHLPAYATSMGKVLLAYKSEEELDTYFKTAELKPLTEHTVYKEDELRKELKEIRKQGYAISEDQLEHGLISAAAPIRNMRGDVIAAINCSANSLQTTREEVENNYLNVLMETAEQISRNTEIELPF
ncbi:Pca regulon regulatory protein [Jeotgalicoccus saudimassiliensis]|uniref:Pca regulon regulatory protein n=1 Tax=Jeotgalicoccus saudimassiliensis TaxID=1461582 RepID=A0A078MEG8_9STAP|nr:IclR family transcriptional regulator C-terminal domain-containing protein [Jeotgalicoccus saudimassiliensis]CEA03852.1 Pca regulon regulatory protein [Jeotgalicoccus saudimassiliensis]